MAIAGMISDFSQQQLNYGAVVGQSLQQLGQQIGQQLALREYQKQAQAALPALQQTYTSAMDKIQAGQVTEGYRDILNAQLQFGTTQNPFIARMNEMAGGIAEQAASDFLKMKQYEIQYGPRPTTTTTPGLPAVDVSKYGFEGSVGTPPPVSPTQQGDAGVVRQVRGTIVEPESLPQEDMEANFTDVPAEPRPEPTPAQAAAAQNFQDVISLPVDQQYDAARQYSVSEDAINTDQYDLVKIPGVEKYIPDFVGFQVPKEKWKESGATLTGTGMLSRQSKLTAPEARDNFFKTGADRESRGTEQNIKAAIETMKDRQMSSLFNEFNKDIYALRQAAGASPSGTGEVTYTVVKKDGQEQEITEDQFMAIQELAAIVPSTAENAGGTPAVFKPRKKEAAPAAGGTQERFPVKQVQTQPPPPTPAPGPTPVPFGEQYATPEERERAMTERIRGGIGAGLRAVGRGGEAILRGARAIR